MRNIILKILLLFTVCTSTSYAFAPSNFFRAYENALWLPYVPDVHFEVGVRSEYGAKSTGRDGRHEKQNVLALYDPTQSTLAMLSNPSSILKANDGYKQIVDVQLGGALPAVQDTRGLQLLSGNFSELDTTIFANYEFSLGDDGGGWVTLNVPVISKQLDGIMIKDLTNATTPDDVKLKDFVTNNLAANVLSLSDLDLSSWSQIGLGDLSLTLEGVSMVYHDDNFNKMVALFSKLGILFPTSREKDEDKAFSMPLGNDGAWGMPFGLGLKYLVIPYHFACGIDGDVTWLWDQTRVRRLKTDKAQTEFLLLNKAKATKRFGLTWQAHAFVEFFKFLKGFSAKAHYQYVCHQQDKLLTKEEGFVGDIINSVQSLKGWDVHNVIFSLSYDFSVHYPENSMRFVPLVQLFYKLGVSGTRVIDNNSFGGQLAITF